MPLTIDNDARLLVTGASGQLGQLVLKHLLDTVKVPPSNIIASSRNPDKLAAFAARGVVTRRLDFSDAASVEAAARGVDRALMIAGDDLRSRLDDHKTAITALVAAGVKHILYTSMHNADNTLWFIKADHLATEAFLRESKVPGYTILRNGIYFDNDIGIIAGAKHSGTWPSAAKGGKLAAISRDDLAYANALALASNEYENQTYELSGNVGISFEDMAANVSKVLGKSIKVVHVTEEQLAQDMADAFGVPLEMAQAIAHLQTATAEGTTGPTAEDFKNLTGRHPQPHAEWVESIKDMLLAL